MVPVALYDSLILRPRSDGQITLRGIVSRSPGATSPTEFAALPPAAENIAVRAVKLVQKQAGETRGADLELTKRIPIAAGLAGGSTDAAAALTAANTAWGLNWSHSRLADLAAELGSDVPFFLQRGPAVCRGRGERVEPLGNMPPLHVVIASPAEGLSTASVYRQCRAASKPCSAQALIAAWRRGRIREIGRQLHNRLEPAAASLCPAVERLGGEFARLDVCGRLMSGSGSSYFGLCRHARHARRIAASLRARGVSRVVATMTCR